MHPNLCLNPSLVVHFGGLGQDTKELLAAACDRFEGLVDVADILEAEKELDASIALIRCQGVFHSDKAISEDSGEWDDEDSWLDIGMDSEAVIQQALDKLLAQTAEAGLDKDNVTHLRGLVREYKDIFRLRVGPGPPAKVEPTRLHLSA